MEDTHKQEVLLLQMAKFPTISKAHIPFAVVAVVEFGCGSERFSISVVVEDLTECKSPQEKGDAAVCEVWLLSV